MKPLQRGDSDPQKETPVRGRGEGSISRQMPSLQVGSSRSRRPQSFMDGDTVALQWLKMQDTLGHVAAQKVCR
jgi:hypothetical protein